MLILELGYPPNPRTPWLKGNYVGIADADFAPSEPQVRILVKICTYFAYRGHLPKKSILPKSASAIPIHFPFNQGVLGLRGYLSSKMSTFYNVGKKLCHFEFKKWLAYFWLDLSNFTCILPITGATSRGRPKAEIKSLKSRIRLESRNQNLKAGIKKLEIKNQDPETTNWKTSWTSQQSVSFCGF